MEGVMMKNGNKYAVAVRKSDGDIVVDTQVFKNTGGESWVNKTPIIRGVAAFVDSLRLGMGTLMYSAEFFEDDEEESTKKKKKSRMKKEQEDKLMMTATVILSIVLAVGIFMLLPYFLSQLLKKVITSPFLLTLCEGVIRIVLFLGYILAISCMKDIKRVFMYHGAEHKSINCIENGCILSVDNVKKQSRRHKRCGTSFLLIVMIISVFFFMFIRVDSAWLRIVLRLLLIPVIAGISYEFIRLAGRSESKIVDFLSKPGLALQGLTTAEPDDAMIEVAIASVEAVFDWKHFLATYDEPGQVNCDTGSCPTAAPGEADGEDEEFDTEDHDEKPDYADHNDVISETVEAPTPAAAPELSKKPDNTASKKPSGEQPKKPDNAAPKKPSGEQPKKPDNAAPKKPSGEQPKKPDNNAPKKPSGEQPKKLDNAAQKKPSDDRIKKPDDTDISGKTENTERTHEPSKQDTSASADTASRYNRGYTRTGRFATADMTKPILVEDDDDEDDDILKALDRMFTTKNDEEE